MGSSFLRISPATLTSSRRASVLPRFSSAETCTPRTYGRSRSLATALANSPIAASTGSLLHIFQ
jgi:hypothetical protein